MCGSGACMHGGGVHGKGPDSVIMAGGMHGTGACVAGETATEVGGTHNTGTHSCYYDRSRVRTLWCFFTVICVNKLIGVMIIKV